MRDLAMGIPPDLRRRAFVVGERIIRIGKLVENQALAVCLHAFGHIAGFFHPPCFRRQHKFRAVGRHALPALDRQVFRHDQNHAVAPHCRDHGKCDTGVATGGFNQGIARLDAPALLRPADHRQRRPVLHRAGRVVAFELGKNDVAGGPRNALQAYQWRVANDIIEGLAGAGWTAIHLDR